MSDAAQAFNAGHGVTVDGKEYTISLMTTSSQAKWEAWAKTKMRHEAFEMLGPDAPPSIRAEMVKWCFSDEARLGIAQQMQSLEGIHKELELSLRQSHPDITEAEVLKVLDVLGPKELVALMEDMFEDRTSAEIAEQNVKATLDMLGLVRVKQIVKEWEKGVGKPKDPPSLSAGKPS